MVSIWSAPANIALIKYWGKKEIQLPANPSLSFSLQNSRSITQVETDTSLKAGTWTFSYDGKPNAVFEKKLKIFFDRIREELSVLDRQGLRIHSKNNFPHSSGISSSASFYASLALCLCELENHAVNRTPGEKEFFQSASRIARLGSGSAARSVYGGFNLWGQSDIRGSSDEYSIPVNTDIHPDFSEYRDAVLIISSEVKSLSSSAGHALMNENPFGPSRYSQARQHLKTLYAALQKGDHTTVIKITEQEALTLHGLIMSSSGGTLLMTPQTVEAIKKIREYRTATNSKCCFTLDAGPNIHFLYPDNEKEKIHNFIRTDLASLCENQQWIDDHLGAGPMKHKNFSL